MSNVRAVAGRYAQALSSAVPERDAFARVAAEVRVVVDAVDASPELRRALANPVITPDSKRRVVRALLERKAPDPRTLRFIDLLADRDRLVLLSEIAAAVDGERNRREGVHEVLLSSAAPLDEALKARIVVALQKVTGGTVQVTETIEPELLGGVVARVGETLYDASLRTRLEQLRERMVGDGAGAAG